MRSYGLQLRSPKLAEWTTFDQDQDRQIWFMKLFEKRSTASGLGIPAGLPTREVPQVGA